MRVHWLKSLRRLHVTFKVILWIAFYIVHQVYYNNVDKEKQTSGNFLHDRALKYTFEPHSSDWAFLFIFHTRSLKKKNYM